MGRRGLAWAAAVVVAAAVSIGAPPSSPAASGYEYRDGLSLDVHHPAVGAVEGGRRPAVVWIHGGAFKRGSRSGYRHVWERFVAAGYVTVSIDYRLDPEAREDVADMLLGGIDDAWLATVRAAAGDARVAIEWVRANAAALGVDPDRIAVAGHSAGAITAEMVAFAGAPVAAVVAMAGAVVPDTMVDIDPGEPPLLVVHGLRDEKVPYAAAAAVCRATRAVGNVCEQALDPNQGHGTFGVDAVVEFLARAFSQ